MRILIFLSAFLLGSGCARQNAHEGVRVVSLSPGITEIQPSLILGAGDGQGKALSRLTAAAAVLPLFSGENGS